MNNFPREDLILYKSDRTRIENVKALVGEKFLIENTDVVIEEGDFFERKLPNGLKEFYCVTDRGFIMGMGRIPDHYQISVKKVGAQDMEEKLVRNNNSRSKEMEKQHKVFISHSTADKEYMNAFVELLEAIGVPENSIVCTSVPEYGIPGESKIYDWLREQFTTCKLRVVFALSENYYNSPASLNEMGAAWITQASHNLMLLPGFKFDDVEGCIDSTKIGISLGGDETELKHRLNELKDTLLKEYSLPPIKSEKWERHRDEFISKIHEIEAQKEGGQPERPKLNVQNHDDSTVPESLPIESLILLAYAADADGQITRISGKEGIIISAGGKNVMKDATPRESALWQNALDILLKMGLVESKGHASKVFGLTLDGFKTADLAKEQLNLVTSKDPQTILNEYR